MIVAGEFPFALGAALALLALLALQRGRRWIAAALVILVLAASPVAFVLLAIVLVGTAAARPLVLRGKTVPALAVVLTATAELLVVHLFPSGTLEFPGILVGPFRGRDAIGEAYRTQPPELRRDERDGRIAHILVVYA